jgi:hypothetical protein
MAYYHLYLYGNGLHWSTLGGLARLGGVAPHDLVADSRPDLIARRTGLNARRDRMGWFARSRPCDGPDAALKYLYGI